MAKIMLVDDAAFMRMMLKNTLSQAGYTDLVEAEDGAKAVEVYAAEKPDLVFMDITMPNKDGLDNKIKNWFKKERREENILKGREMLEREVKRLGYEVKVLATPEKLKVVGNKLRIDTDENLLATLGYGGVTLNTCKEEV